MALSVSAVAASESPVTRAADPPWTVLAQRPAARISLAEAAERVQAATGGRVLDARDEGAQYRIKVLTRQGEVRVVTVDARTGAMR